MTTTSSPPKILSTIPSTATSESVNTTPTLSPVSPQGKCWLIDQGSRYKCAEIYLGLKYTDIYLYITEPPTSFNIIKNKRPVEHGGQITVVDGKVETVVCESRKSNPAPELKWFLGEKQLTPSVQNNVTELNDTRRWRSYSELEHIFTLNDFGKLLTCRVYHPAYAKSPQETSVSLDLLCKI